MQESTSRVQKIRLNWFPNLRELMLKQFYTHKRNPKGVFFIFLSPIFVCLLLFIFQIIANSVIDNPIRDPVLSQNGLIPKCVPPRSGGDCISVGYAIIGDKNEEPLEDWANYTLNYIANTSNLKMGSDVKGIFKGSTIADLNQHLIDNQNRTQFGLVFCNGKLNYMGKTIDCQSPIPSFGQKIIFYLLLYNTSLVPHDHETNIYVNYPTYPYLANLKLATDSAIAQYWKTHDTFGNLIEDNQEKSTSDDYSDEGQDEVNHSSRKDLKSTLFHGLYQDFPSPVSRNIKGLSIVSSAGSIVFPMGSMVVFVILLNEIASEKDKKLRIVLNLAGTQHFEYYFSWVIIAIFYSALNALGLLLGGFACGFDLFTGTTISLMFTVFFGFNLGLCFIAILTSSIVSSSKTAYTASYGFLICAIAIQLEISDAGIMPYLYDDTNSFLIRFCIWLFELYPPFPFSRLYNYIQGSAGTSFNFRTQSWKQSSGADWKEIFESVEGRNAYMHTTHIPAAIWSIFWQIIGIGVISILIYYFDHVIASNRGTGESWLFCLQRKERQNQKNQANHNNDDSSQQNESTDVSSMAANILQIQGLDKIYSNYELQIRNKCPRIVEKKLQALNNINLEFEKDQISTLLGPNGAGKTSFISILAGLTSQYTGSVMLDRINIKKNKKILKKTVGYCPQYDILWEELTAREHLVLFARIKKICKKAIPEQIEQILRYTNLSSVADNAVSTYSGGMKRRLSIALALLGDPKVLLLDEPTTGLDPKTRREIWTLVKSAAKNRVLLLTTHDMDEADALSDRIMIINKGVIKYDGTSLSLKNDFGSGYQLTLTFENKISRKNSDDSNGSSNSDGSSSSNHCSSGSESNNSNSNSENNTSKSVENITDNNPNLKKQKQNENSISSKIKTNKEEIISSLQQICPSLTISHSNANEVTFVVPFQQKIEIKKLLLLLENKMDGEETKIILENIQEWTISHPRLEEAFLSVIKQKEVKQDDIIHIKALEIL